MRERNELEERLGALKRLDQELDDAQTLVELGEMEEEPDTEREGVEALKKLLETDPPYGARVMLDLEKAGSGWNAPQLSKWLEDAVADASQAYFGQPPAYMGEGGSIPFMGMLGEKFPNAQFLITGVLGPHSNAHGPNEFLHIPMGKRVTMVVADVVAKHAQPRG